MIEVNELGVKVLSQIASDPERIGRFIDITGIRADTIREASTKPEFWPALFEYIVSDEPLLLQIASEIGELPETIVIAHRKLSPPDYFE